MRSLALAAALLAACAAAPVPRAPGATPAAPDREAAEALERFAEAARGGRWEAAWALLSAPWRARTTPARLALDWKESGPVGPEAAERALALLRSGAAPAVSGSEAVLAIGPGRRARLVAEPGGWRVEALE